EVQNSQSPKWRQKYNDQSRSFLALVCNKTNRSQSKVWLPDDQCKKDLTPLISLYCYLHNTVETHKIASLILGVLPSIDDQPFLYKHIILKH
uniref:hypothetical protein n=1 Tax=Vibrio parahaemolyticus TaxID=670 RepID=UPI00248B1504